MKKTLRWSMSIFFMTFLFPGARAQAERETLLLDDYESDENVVVNKYSFYSLYGKPMNSLQISGGKLKVTPGGKSTAVHMWVGGHKLKMVGDSVSINILPVVRGEAGITLMDKLDNPENTVGVGKYSCDGNNLFNIKNNGRDEKIKLDEIQTDTALLEIKIEKKIKNVFYLKAILDDGGISKLETKFTMNAEEIFFGIHAYSSYVGTNSNHYFFDNFIFNGELPTVNVFTDKKINHDVTPALQLNISKEALSNINPLDLLAQEGSNLIAWVTSPLNVDIPDDFRANISLLREDLLDGHAKGSASPEIYKSAVELCDNLMACIDKKEKQQIDAKLRVAQAKQRSPLSNQALEARRNYLMSWPQYHREVRQREVLAEEKDDTTEVKASELELAWIETAGKLRKSLDVKYSAYRAALRKK